MEPERGPPAIDPLRGAMNAEPPTPNFGPAYVVGLTVDGGGAGGADP
jgi:hypothetical protein